MRDHHTLFHHHAGMSAHGSGETRTRGRADCKVAALSCCLTQKVQESQVAVALTNKVQDLEERRAVEQKDAEEAHRPGA
eukprot:1369884-Rhodomonas_salina.2